MEAAIITYAILGGPYYNDRLPSNPILIIKAPMLRFSVCRRV